MRHDKLTLKKKKVSSAISSYKIICTLLHIVKQAERVIKYNMHHGTIYKKNHKYKHKPTKKMPKEFRIKSGNCFN